MSVSCSPRMSAVQHDSASTRVHLLVTWSREVEKNPDLATDHREFCDTNIIIRIFIQCSYYNKNTSIATVHENITIGSQNLSHITSCCRMTSYERLRWLVETLSHEVHHHRMMNVSVVNHATVHCRMVTWPCDTALLHGHVSTHHCKLAQLISINLRSATAVLTVSKSQNVKDRSRANKYLRKIKVNLQTKADICTSTNSNADVVCYRTTWRTELYDSCLIVKKS